MSDFQLVMEMASSWLVFGIKIAYMLKIHLRTAWRYLVKNKTHSFINIAGLTVGMAVALLIGLWIWDELSFDKYHLNYDHIALVEQNMTNNGQVQTMETAPYPLADELRKNYGSDFKYVVTGAYLDHHILALGEKKLTQTGNFLEPQAPDMLSLKMLHGTRDGLKDPASILLSATVAKAFFGDADPINKSMKLDNKMDVKVTGVYQDLPYNSTLADLAFIAPWKLFFDNTEWIRTIADPWRPNAFFVYVQIADHGDMAKISAKIRDAKLARISAALAKMKPELFLQPMNKWHLYSAFWNGKNIGGRIQYVWLFGIIGGFVLLLACINFMNLSTARSEQRAKEVGIRKAIGSGRAQLIGQFFSEAFLTVIFSFACSLLLVQLSLPFFNEVAGKDTAIPWNRPLFWVLGFGFCLITGLISGSYPAFYLSSFRPVKVLKGKILTGPWAAFPRKVLVVLQFTVSIILIVGTIVVFRQIQFARNRPIGYDRNGLIAMDMITPAIHDHFDAVKQELLASGAIVNIAEAGNPTTGIGATSSGFDWPGKDPNLAIGFPDIDVSYDYGRTIGWEFKEGRDFSKDRATDSAGLVLNESAIKFMGLNHPVGQTIKWFDQPYKIIGVIRDMVMGSPYQPVLPSVFYLSSNSGSVIMLKLNPAAGVRESLDKIAGVFSKYNPAQPFEYKFVDEEYAKKFGGEEQVGILGGFFAILAIFISCMGLFGMASFMAEQRIKEIGIRKVLGASVFSLWGLLSKDFVALVVLAILIATPAAWYFMSHWLQGYGYHAHLSWWIFAMAGTGALLITLATVSYQAIRTALINPATSLRAE